MSCNIGIVGNGFVGSAIAAGFILNVDEIYIYDVVPEKSTHTLRKTLNSSDIVFVSVPTPMKEVTGGDIDLSIMDSVLGEIAKENKRDNVIVIKSTVVPGTVERYQAEYPQLNLVFNPEFLTERKARLDFINTARIVLGGKKSHCDRVEEVYRRRFPYTPIVKTDLATAQLIKYMANCFFAVKVSYMNEMRQICDAVGANWEDTLHGFIADGRIGNSHIDVPGHDGDCGFGGKCFPKDLNAIMHMAKSLGVNPLLLESAWQKNLEVRTNYDWSEIKGAVSED
jgi:nucleotide sugar dehydrogenase